MFCSRNPAPPPRAEHRFSPALGRRDGQVERPQQGMETKKHFSVTLNKQVRRLFVPQIFWRFLQKTAIKSCEEPKVFDSSTLKTELKIDSKSQ